MDQFRSFKDFVPRIDKYGMKSGIVKIRPPQEWYVNFSNLADLGSLLTTLFSQARSAPCPRRSCQIYKNQEPHHARIQCAELWAHSAKHGKTTILQSSTMEEAH